MPHADGSGTRPRGGTIEPLEDSSEILPELSMINHRYPAAWIWFPVSFGRSTRLPGRVCVSRDLRAMVLHWEVA
jgi:hypothetical protein